MKDLESRIWKGFQDSIAISHWKEEYNMKKAMARKVVVLSMVGILCVFGSFLTVNAATGGELIENIKNVVTYRFQYRNFKDLSPEEQNKLQEEVSFHGAELTGISGDAVVTGHYYFQDAGDGSAILWTLDDVE